MSLVSSEGESYCSVQWQARNDPKPEGRRINPLGNSHWEWIHTQQIQLKSCRDEEYSKYHSKVTSPWQRPSTVSPHIKEGQRPALTKHSAASSIIPSWKRCSSWKVFARALRRVSDGSTFSLLHWNWLKIPCGEEVRQREKHNAVTQLLCIPVCHASISMLIVMEPNGPSRSWYACSK